MKTMMAAKMGAEEKLRELCSELAELQRKYVDAQTEIKALWSKVEELQVVKNAPAAELQNAATSPVSLTIRQELQTLQLELHRHVSPLQLKRASPSFKQLEKVIFTHLQGNTCPTHTVTPGDGSTAHVTVVDMDAQTSPN